MPQISIEYASGGMVLECDVVTPQGRVFLKQGVTLTEDNIRMCKMWGVADLGVQGVSHQEILKAKLAALPPAAQAGIKAATLRKFRNHQPGSVFLKELANLYALRLIDRHPDIPGENPETVRPDQFPQPSKTQSLEALMAVSQKPISLPDVFHKIVALLRDPTASMDRIAEVVGKDQGLASTLLRLVNSPYYGYSRKIDTLSRAVVVIGSEQLASIALGVLVTAVFQDVPADVLDVESFWRHGLACALIAKMLSCRHPDVSPERMFVCGLLHDIGKAVVFSRAPGQGMHALMVSIAEDRPAWRVERELWAFDHCDVAQRLLSEWKFPADLVRAVASHHRPNLAGAGKAGAILHLTDILAHIFDYGLTGVDAFPSLSEEIWRVADLPVGALYSLGKQLDEQFLDIRRYFFTSQ